MRLRRTWALPFVAATGAAILFACGDDDDTTTSSVDGSAPDGTIDGATHDATVSNTDGSAPSDATTDATGDATPDTGVEDSGAPEEAGADAEAGTDAGDDGGADASADAGTSMLVPVCSGLGFATSDLTKLRLAPDGTLFAQEGDPQDTGTIHRYTAATTATTCVLTEDKTFAVTGTVRDFDLDAAGNLYVLGEQTDGKIGIGKRNPTTGAATSTPCEYAAPNSHVIFGQVAISPDGTKASVVSAASIFPTPAATDVAFTIAMDTCTSAVWTPTDVADCTFGDGVTIQANTIRDDGTLTWLSCDSGAAGYPFGASTSTKHLGSNTAFFNDMAISSTAYDFVFTGDGVYSYDRTTSALTNVDASQVLGGPTTFPQIAKMYLMTDPVGGKRFVEAEDGVGQTKKVFVTTKY